MDQQDTKLKRWRGLAVQAFLVSILNTLVVALALKFAMGNTHPVVILGALGIVFCLSIGMYAGYKAGLWGKPGERG